MIALRRKTLTLTLLVLVTAFSYCTYFYNYSNPQAFFWDENYHITSAQKYLNGVFFMQSHPPLGKLLIALGEKIIDANPTDDQFLDVDYATSLPAGFSFTGYRFFPALLGWLAAPIIFGIFLLITNRPWMAFFFSFLYIFDNALIVHSRGAMLESPLLFFSAACIWGFFLVLKSKNSRGKLIASSFFYGAMLGCAFGTKLVALILILLAPGVVWLLLPHWKKIMMFTLASAVGFIAVTIMIWHVHFTLGRVVNPKLYGGGYYTASTFTKNIVDEGKTGLISSFPALLWDNLKFAGPSNTGVPTLDLCKFGENGSPTIFWPLGARSINYRWNTPDGERYQYLYLQVNPVIWGFGLAGLLLSLVMLCGHIFLGIPKWSERLGLMVIFGGMYVAYMLTMIRIEQARVMYLYHYFTPLLFSFVLFGLAFMEIKQFGKHVMTERLRLLTSIIIGGLIMAAFVFYSPLTYYKLIGKDAFMRRMIFPLWDLRCVNCPLRDHFYIQRPAS